MVFLYTFNVSGTKFYLSKRNLQSDAPNYFTELIEKYPKRRYFIFDTNPKVFDVIHRHIQGYKVLHTLPVSLADVEKDAAFYGLTNLQLKCKTYAESKYKSLFDNYDTNSSEEDTLLSSVYGLEEQQRKDDNTLVQTHDFQTESYQTQEHNEAAENSFLLDQKVDVGNTHCTFSETPSEWYSQAANILQMIDDDSDWKDWGFLQ